MPTGFCRSNAVSPLMVLIRSQIFRQQLVKSAIKPFPGKDCEMSVFLPVSARLVNSCVFVCCSPVQLCRGAPSALRAGGLRPCSLAGSLTAGARLDV